MATRGVEGRSRLGFDGGRLAVGCAGQRCSGPTQPGLREIPEWHHPGFRGRRARNLGTIDLRVAQAQQLCELELDGVEYHWAGVSRVKSSDFPPGRQYKGIPITLVDSWHSKMGDVPLKMSAGKHILRVIFVVRPGDVTGAARPVRVVSNPVEIEIAEVDVPPDTAPE